MPLDDFLVHQATIAEECPDGEVPAQDALGGADRSGPWATVASGVACLVSERSSTLNYGRNDGRANVILARIYFASGSVAFGINTKYRVTVVSSSRPDATVIGVYAVQGSTDPNYEGRPIEVDCERIRTP